MTAPDRCARRPFPPSDCPSPKPCRCSPRPPRPRRASRPPPAGAPPPCTPCGWSPAGDCCRGSPPQGHDAWRAGPLDADDIAHLRAVAAALPWRGPRRPAARPYAPGLPEPEALVRSFLDAVADTLPRTPAAPHVLRHAVRGMGAAAAARRPTTGPPRSPRAWTRACGSRSAWTCRRTSSSTTARARAARAPPSSRCTASPTPPWWWTLRPCGQETAAPTGLRGRAGGPSFGPRTRVDTALAVRRAARVWPPLDRLAERAVPDVLPLSEDELIGSAGPRGEPARRGGRRRALAAGPRAGPDRDRRTAHRAGLRHRRHAVLRERASCCSSAGSSRSAVTRSARPRWTPWPRRTGPSCGCGTAGCWSIPPWSARHANASSACSTRWTRSPSP